jgi:glutaredoxin
MITIYATTKCLVCSQAVELCKQYQFDYNVVYIDKSEANQVLFRTKYPQVDRVPLIEWHGNTIGGYNQFLQEIENTLNTYGEGKL